MKAGIIFRLGSFWVGVHWSPYNRRWCINLVPCVTFWIARKGGKTPHSDDSGDSMVVSDTSPSVAYAKGYEDGRDDTIERVHEHEK